jgi:hypothetical protein
MQGKSFFVDEHIRLQDMKRRTINENEGKTYLSINYNQTLFETNPDYPADLLFIILYSSLFKNSLT